METENKRKNPDILNLNDKTYHEVLGPEDLAEAHRMVEEEMEKYEKEEGVKMSGLKKRLKAFVHNSRDAYKAAAEDSVRSE